MKFVIQRVNQASVEVNNNIVGSIDKGFLVLVGIHKNDNKEIADKMVKKLIRLRVFTDRDDRMNLSLKDVGGKILLVSQFTLYANCQEGNRPEFLNAAKPDFAKELYEYIVEKCEEEVEVETGVFREKMKISLINDGPVTIILDSNEIIKY